VRIGLEGRAEFRLGLDPVARRIAARPRVLVAAAVTGIHGFLYFLPNHLRLGSATTLPLTELDRWMPFVPESAWIYWSAYALVFVAFVRCRRPQNVARFLCVMMTAIVAGTLVHWAFPTVYPLRPAGLPLSTDPLTRFGLEFFWAFETPASCLPSLHVATTLVAAIAVLRESRREGWLFLAWAGLVWASTLTLKQHYVLDLVAGAALGLVAWWAWSRVPSAPRAETIAVMRAGTGCD
jgi:membrane-associated phospholipid phosphatase